MMTEFEKAVDVVCMNCCAKDEEECIVCNVRKTIDMENKRKNLQTMQERLLEEKKQKKYEQMNNHQREIIREAMLKGKHSILFTFSDRGYFEYEEVQKPWYEEFYARAKNEFENEGFVIRGIVITW